MIQKNQNHKYNRNEFFLTIFKKYKNHNYIPIIVKNLILNKIIKDQQDLHLLLHLYQVYGVGLNKLRFFDIYDENQIQVLLLLFENFIPSNKGGSFS